MRKGGIAVNKILITTLRFPPAGGVGLRRIIKIAKYLAQNGIEVHFITTHNSHEINNYENDIKASNIFINKIPSLSLNNLFNFKEPTLAVRIFRRILYYITLPIYFIDYATLWGIILVPYMYYYMKKNNIKYVYVSGPPFSVVWHVAILKHFMGKKMVFIAEWRDLWIEYYGRIFLWPKCISYRIQKKMERYCIQQADSVVSVTEDLSEVLKKKTDYEKKIITIENGYDPDEFIQKPDTLKAHQQTRQLIYAGNIMNTRKEALIILLKAIKVLKDMKVKCCLRILGEISYDAGRTIQQKYADLLASNYVILEGLKSPQEAIEAIAQSDYGVVFIQREHPEALPSKMFEYCALNKTMICIGPEGEMKKRVEKNQIGLYVCLGQDSAIDQIVKFIELQKSFPQENFSEIQQQGSFRTIALRMWQLCLKSENKE